jgi:uncharacterized membrane protein YkvA (DUF1232 family)
VSPCLPREEEGSLFLKRSGFRSWQSGIRSLTESVRFLWRVARHLQTLWTAKLIAACGAAYVVSPIQLIPTFIPVIGQMDDLLVLYFVSHWTVKLVPENVLAECREPIITCYKSESLPHLTPSAALEIVNAE